MKKLTISFLGRDCPGIVSAVSQILGQTGCNIIEVTQTILAVSSRPSLSSRPLKT